MVGASRQYPSLEKSQTMTANLFQRLRAGFPADPAAPCLIVPGGPTYSFADLDRQSAKMAHRLAEAGAGRGDRIAVQVEKSPAALW